jgi:hypothetical protein
MELISRLKSNQHLSPAHVQPTQVKRNSAIDRVILALARKTKIVRCVECLCVCVCVCVSNTYPQIKFCCCSTDRCNDNEYKVGANKVGPGVTFVPPSGKKAVECVSKLAVLKGVCGCVYVCKNISRWL